MLVQKVLKAGEELTGVAVISTVMRRTDVFDNHMPDSLDPMRLFKKRAGKTGGDYVRDMLMLRNGAHFGFAEAAQRNAIMPRDHADT